MTVVDPGRRVLGGRYELQRVIATGGMGQVWRARDALFDRPVAVKVLRGEYAEDPGFAARFRGEATHAARLNHPNIAAVIDYGEDALGATGEHGAYLVMELVDGKPLTERLAEAGPMDTETAVSVLRQTAAALAEAHRAGVVHRDVKPANILIRPDGSVKLTDFGISQSATSAPITRTGQVVGTPQYMSPEQARGEPAVPASDVYSLGLVGYEALAGRAAFAGDNAVTIALQQVTRSPEPLPSELPADVRALIDATLAKDPVERIPDGGALLAAIDEAMSGRAPQPPASRTLPVPGVSRPPRDPAASRRPRGSGHRRRNVVALAAVLLLGVLAVGVALARTAGRPDVGSPAVPSVAVSPDGGVVLAAEDYLGRPVDEVTTALTALGLEVQRRQVAAPDSKPGTVTAIDPVGTRLLRGDDVQLTVAAGGRGAGTGGAAGTAGGGPTREGAEASPGSGSDGAQVAGRPDTARAGTTAPETTAPQSEPPATPPPGTTAPATTASGSTAPATTAPASTAPGSTASGSTAPESTAPASTAPGSTAPESTAPASTAPGTTARDTTAPGGGSSPATPDASAGAAG